MGSVIRYTHKECNFAFDFFDGVGFRTFAMQCESRKHMRDGDWGEQWQSLIEQYPEGAATFRKALCYCEKCKKYFAEPRIKFYIPKEGYHYKRDDGKDYVPSYIIDEHYQLLEEETITCPDCDSVVTIMKKLSAIPCPVCGKMRRGRAAGCWD